MHTSPANQSNNANIKPPNEPAPKQQNFECSEDTFKMLEAPVEVDMSRYSFKRLESVKNSCVNFFNKIFNAGPESASKAEGVLHMHFVENAKDQLLLFVNIKEGVVHLDIADFKSSHIKQATEENRNFAIFNHVNKKIFMHESMKGLDFANAIVNTSTPNHQKHISAFQSNIESHEAVYLSDDEWSNLTTFLEQNLPEAEAKEKDSTELKEKHKESPEQHRLPNAQERVGIKREARKEESTTATIEENFKREYLKQELNIENDGNKRHREKTLENERIKVKGDIDKQLKRTIIAEEDIKIRDSKLNEKKEPNS